MIKRKKTVAILSYLHDEHANLIAPKIEELGGKVLRINTDEFSINTSLNFFPSRQNWEITTPNGHVAQDEVFSLWIRRPFPYCDSANDLQRILVINEQNEVSKTIPLIFDQKALIVDHPVKTYLAGRKIHQLFLAKQLGFRIPDTCITNSVKTAEEFVSKYKYDAVIKKVSSNTILNEEKGLLTYTTKLQKNSDLSLVKNCPTLFQENIKKKFEARITVIGRKIFAVAYDSQSIPSAKIDSKKGGDKILKVKHWIIKLPILVRRKILKLVGYYGLNFSAIDMAVTPDNQWIFFELNPAGQFLWLEDVAGVPLALEMAKFLLGIEK